MYNKRTFAVTPRTISGFLEDVLQTGWNQLNEEVSSFNVPVNIQETDKSYVLHVVAPGLKKEDFKLNIDHNVLNISLDHKEETTEQTEKPTWLRTEYRTKSFKRSFTLNDKVDATKIGARYADGILFITLPKKEATTPASHEISVS